MRTAPVSAMVGNIVCRRFAPTDLLAVLLSNNDHLRRQDYYPYVKPATIGNTLGTKKRMNVDLESLVEAISGVIGSLLSLTILYSLDTVRCFPFTKAYHAQILKIGLRPTLLLMIKE
ncbi:unnamed protein product [Lathyrus oleraceus]